MGMTIAEKILVRQSGRDVVRAGDLVVDRSFRQDRVSRSSAWNGSRQVEGQLA
jgi:hypothetical protein